MGLLHQGSAVLAEPAHHRPVGRFVDFNQDSAALAEPQFLETLHQIPT